MARFRKPFAMMLALLLCMGIFAVPVFAAESAQDGLEVTLTTDRDIYTSGEAITAALTVTNTGREAVSYLRMDALIPEGYTLAAGQSNVLLADTMEPGETAALTVTFEARAAAGEEDIQVPTTGDAATVVGWLALAGAAVLGLVVMPVMTGKSGRRVMPLALCGMVCLSMLGAVPAQASTPDLPAGSIGVETVVQMDGVPVTLRAVVAYQPPAGEEQIPGQTVPEETVPGGIPTEWDLEADEVYFVTGAEYTVTFTVAAGTDAGEIGLYRDGEWAGAMHDDGLAGDTAASDGVYSFRMTDTEQEAGSADYHAASAASRSDPVTVYHFAPLTAETAEQAREVYTAVNQSLQRIESAYRGDSGFVTSGDVDAIMAEAAAYLAGVYADGDIVRYEIDGSAAYIKFASGLTMIYEPTLEGVSTGGSGVSVTFMTYQPHPDIADPAVPGVMDSLAEEYDVESETYEGQAVSLNQVKAMGADQVVFWNGHGGYGPIVKSFLASGEYFDWNAWWWDTTGYYWDCVQDRIINRSTDKQEELACFTSKFVSHYCGDLSGSMLFLASCHSGQNSNLADAFLARGAEAVVGFTDTVYTGYCLNMGIRTMVYMNLLNADTDNYHTLAEALERAKDDLGDDDIAYARQHPEIFTNVKSEVAEPRIFGDGGYRYLTAATGTLSGRICDAADRSTPIPSASILVDWLNEAQWNGVPDANGNYSMELPTGNFQVTITAPGYMPFTAYAAVTAGGNTYMETFLLIEESEEETGVAAGTITNALTGTGIEGASLEIRQGWNNACTGDVAATAVTDASGGYSVELPLGNYTVSVSKDGFIPTLVNIVVLPGTTGSQNGSMTPVISGDSYRVVITWGADPRDLDSHVAGTLSSGGSFHVFYAHKSQYDGSVEVCNLDVDDVSSYGPETITLNPTTDEPCYCYVHHFAGSGTLASSEAQVKVYQGESLVATFNVPTDQGSGRYWNVFAIVDGRMVVRDTITGAADTAYADAQR